MKYFYININKVCKWFLTNKIWGVLNASIFFNKCSMNKLYVENM